MANRIEAMPMTLNRVSVRLSVRLSQVRVVPKRLNVGLLNQCSTIAQRF